MSTNIPKAQTACSHTVWLDEFNKFKNNGTAPAETTAWVWRDVPLAILVKAHAASNCNVGLRKIKKIRYIIIHHTYYLIFRTTCYWKIYNMNIDWIEILLFSIQIK